MDTPVEFEPPSPKPKRHQMLEFETPEAYYRELANRIEKHIQTHVLGVTAKKEIGFAVRILRQLGGDDVDLPH